MIILEGSKIRTYVQTNCLVKRSSMEKCRSSFFNMISTNCIQPNWLVQYIDYDIEEETTITSWLPAVMKGQNPNQVYKKTLNRYKV